MFRLRTMVLAGAAALLFGAPAFAQDDGQVVIDNPGDRIEDFWDRREDVRDRREDRRDRAEDVADRRDAKTFATGERIGAIGAPDN